MEFIKHRNGTFTLLIVVFSFLFQGLALANNSALTYQGRILKSSGDPLSYGSVSFIFQITDPSGNCVLYKEQLDGIDMSKSGGLFDIGIGKGTVSYQAGSVLSDIFKNGVSLNCQGTGTYTATATDERLLKVQFYDGTSWNSITPAAPIRSVPTALNAVSADKLGANVASDFVLKTGIPTCTAGTVLTYDGTSLTCVAGGGGGAGTGTVTNISSANSYITIANATTTPALTLNVGTTANTVAAGNDSRIVGAIQTGSAAGGDLSGTLPNPTVGKLQGVPVSNVAPASGNILKYDGTKWVGASLSTTDVSGIGTYQTQAAFNTAVGSANCTTSQTPYWNSVSGSFQCQAINVGLAGDVTGSIGASVVSKLQGSTLTITTPASGQYLKYNGTAFVNSALNSSDLSGTIPAANMPAFTGDVTSSAGSTALTLAATGTAGTYYKVTTDSKGRVTSGAASLVAGDIPNLDWSKITTGVPTTLAGYGITDSISNGGGVGKISAGADASKPATPASGDLFVTTDTQKIYRYTGSSWDLVSSAGGTGGTITNVTPGTGLTGGGSSGAVTLNVDVGTGANKIVQLDGSGKLPVLDASQLTGLQASQIPSMSAAKITSGVLAVAQGGTGQGTYTDGQLLIGDGTTNGLAKATLTAGSGISITNGNGSITIAASGGGGTVTNVTGTSPISVATGTSTPVVSLANGSAAGQVYRWDGTSAWAATKLKYTDLVNVTSASPWPASSCTAGQAITWSSASDSFSCTAISLDGSQVTGTVAAGQMPAFTGDVTSSAGSTALTLSNSGVTAGTYTSVTVDAKGRVTSGTSPTTLSGYGITDAVKNAGGVGNISAGVDASKPGAPAAGDIYLATDTSKIYQYNSGAWAVFSSGSVSNNVTLADGKVWVGNGSNAATEVSVSGDATLSNAGVLTLANSGATAGTYFKVTVDAKGRVTSGAALAAGDITSALTFSPLNKAGDTMSGALNLGGNDITNGGNITMAANKYLTLSSNSSAGSTAGQMWYDSTSNVIKYYDGSAVQTLGVSGSGLSNLNGLTASSQSFAIGTSGNSPAWNSATSTHTLNIPMASTASVTAGLLSNTDWNTFNNKVGTGTSFAGDVTGTVGATVVSQVGGVTATNVATGANFANAVISSTTTSDKTANAIVTQGQISSGSLTYSNSANSIDWNNGNVISTNFDCGSAFSFSNMKDGGTYTLVVTGTGTTKCSFPSTVDSQAVTYYFKPTNSTRTASSMTAYTFMRVGNNILVSWASGFSSVGN